MDDVRTTEESDTDTAAEAAAAADAAAPAPSRSRLRRWARRSALVCAALLVLVTAASFTYNAFTSGRAAPPPGLTYVEAAGIHTRYETWGETRVRARRPRCVTC